VARSLSQARGPRDRSCGHDSCQASHQKPGATAGDGRCTGRTARRERAGAR